MKKIAIFQSDLHVGGIQKSLVNILNELDFTRCEVDLYLYEQGEFFTLPTHENLHVNYCKPLPSWSRLVYFDLLLALTKDVTQGKEYDIAVDFNSYRNECALGAIKANAKKRVMWIHNDVEIKLKNEPKYKILWHFFHKKLSYYDMFAAVSPGIIDGFRRTTGIQDKPIVSIPNHIDAGEIFRKKDVTVDLSVDPNKINLCSVGRLCHQKGYDLLLNYFAEARTTRPDLHLYLIGDGPDRQALTLQIASLGLDDAVTFLGNQSNPFCYMNLMDGFVLTSRYEGQGMVIWEAKALGLPLYLSKNLEAYNPGIQGFENITEALANAQRPAAKTYDDLSGYNQAISASVYRLLEL